MSWKTTTDLLAEKLPGYEPRVEQDRLAVQIENAMADREHLLAEAGCGTGKSFAYLAAAIEVAKETREPVVVSTATKALQAQLAAKDLPFLQTLVPDLRFSVVKGRSNYVCQAKLHGQDAEQVPNIAEIRQELALDDEHTGDLDSFTVEIRQQDRSRVAVIADECPGRRECPFGETCFAERAKAEAVEAHVVVANHAVLMRDTQLKIMTDGKASMLPHYSALVIDEAHELEEYATSALGVEFRQTGLERLADDVAVFLGDTDASRPLRQAARNLFTKLDQIMPERETTFALPEERLVEFEEIIDVIDAVRRLRGSVRDFQPESEEQVQGKKRLYRRLDATIGRIGQFVAAESDEIVRWSERSTRMHRGQQITTLSLHFAPLRVGAWLRQNLWHMAPATLVSATLSTGKTGFAFIAERLGFDQLPFESFNAGSPFDFTEQARLYVPKARSLGGTFPNEPRDADWAARTTAEMGELILAAGGRTLALFTSRKAMNDAHAALAPMLKKRKINVYKQGDLPNGKLSTLFLEDETSVLFGLRSFMTGFDAQGDTLRLLILDKLPFPVPSDVIFAARAKWIDDHADGSWDSKSFMKLSVPTMILILLQGFGRLIRTKRDAGMVAIFDPRLRTKGYGKGIMNALPPAQQVDNLADAEEYLVSLRDRR